MGKNVRMTMRLLLSALLLMGTVGCGMPGFPLKSQETEPATSGRAAAEHPLDTSKRVELVMWMTGSSPGDLDQVLAEINKLALRDLNCTVKYNMFNSSDTQQKYLLLLSSGQPVDLMYSANYLNYPQYAKKGAYIPLDDLVPQYAPKLWGFVEKDYWDAAKVNGKIYMVPSMWREYAPSGFLYREDLREKFNLPVPKDIHTIEQYLLGIKENSPNIMPTMENATSVSSLGSYFTSWEVLDLKYKWVDWKMPYGLHADYYKPKELYNYWESRDFIEDMRLFKRWAGWGFWSKNSFASKERPLDAFINGKMAASLGGNINPIRYSEVVRRVASSHPDWKVGYLPYSTPKQLSVPVHPTQNGYSIPRASQNPQRAIAFYEKLVTDREYYRLSQYGIEGKHYRITNGYYETVGDESSSGFREEAMNGWGWKNVQMHLRSSSLDIQNKIYSEFAAFSNPNIYGGFDEDIIPYQGERAALFNVLSQYLIPIEAGFVTDVDASVADFLVKARAAGLDKIQKEFTTQWKGYIHHKEN